MVVGDDIPGCLGPCDHRCVAGGYVDFCHNIDDWCRAVVKLVQALPGVLPVVGAVQRFNRAYLIGIRHAALVQLHAHAGRTQAILVVVITPALFHLHAGQFRRVYIVYRKSACFVA